MSKKVLLVGHCGADMSYLRMAIRSAAPGTEVFSADDLSELTGALDEKPDLVLLNRELGYGFDGERGVDLVRRLKSTYPQIRTMLVSNYAEAQAEAVAAGALPGFGKREIGSQRATQLLRDAIGGSSGQESA